MNFLNTLCTNYPFSMTFISFIWVWIILTLIFRAIDDLILYWTGVQRKYLKLLNKQLLREELTDLDSRYSSFTGSLWKYSFIIHESYSDWTRIDINSSVLSTSEENIYKKVIGEKYKKWKIQDDRRKKYQKQKEEAEEKLRQEKVYLTRYNELLKIKPLDKDLLETIKKCEKKLEIWRQMLHLKGELSRI